MTVPLEKFRRLTQAFDPIYRPGAALGPTQDTAYIPEVHEDFRRQFEVQLQLNDRVKLLLAGQPGCGKTTLLLHVVRRLRSEGRLVAYVDLETNTAVQDLGSMEMHLAVLAELLREAAQAGIAIPPGTRARVRQWLEAVGERAAEKPEVLAEQLTHLLLVARGRPDIRITLRGQLKQRQDPAELLSAVLTDLEAHRPVVVLDGLDKLPPEQARDSFLDQKKKPMVELPGAALLTIPLSLIYEPTFNVLSERYNNADNAVLPAVRLYDFDSESRRPSQSSQGIGVLRRIVEARANPIDENLLMPEAVERAILGSGGNLRELARLIHASIVKAAVRQSAFIELVDVEQAILDQRESFRRAYQPRFLPALKKVREEFQLENTDDVGKLLLYGLWVMEYRHDTAWYCLPKPVEQLLEQLERSRR